MGIDNLESIRENIPFQSPVEPVELTPDTEIQFDCHPGVRCFNACCRNIDITLTPYDILRLKRRVQLPAGEFVATYTMPFAMDHHNMPGLKMAAKPSTSECVFLGEKGCNVYEDRPAACRYYALGSMGVRKKDAPSVEEVYFIVREDHCLGHNEPRELTVAEYRKEQGCEEYDQHNREWREIILKKRSGGPTVGIPSERSLQLFDMCSYDMDSFREFIQTNGFRDVFELSEEQIAAFIENEDQLLEFALRFLKQVLFGEKTIELKARAKEARLNKRKQGT